MKKSSILSILAIIFVLLVGAVVALQQPQDSVTFSGTIVNVSETEVMVDTGSERTSVLIDQSTVFQADDRTVAWSYLRPGFEVDVRAKDVSGAPFVAEEITVTEEPDLLVFEPQSGEAISSPLTVTGEARGSWFFEASFSVLLYNEDGVEIAAVGAEAQDDWMTEAYVPFEAVLSFSDATSTGETGVLVLEKANPSGLPENADAEEIPVQFSDTMTLEVFFGRDIVGTNIVECDAVFPVDRRVERTSGVARAALEELLSGPTQEEIEDRYITSIPEGVEIQHLEIQDGTAYVDFSQAIQQNVGGSCRVQAIRAQINETLRQFPTVDDVVISVDGEVETALQP